MFYAVIDDVHYFRWVYKCTPAATSGLIVTYNDVVLWEMVWYTQMIWRYDMIWLDQLLCTVEVVDISQGEDVVGWCEKIRSFDLFWDMAQVEDKERRAKENKGTSD